jgi:hypothetical protein
MSNNHADLQTNGQADTPLLISRKIGQRISSTHLISAIMSVMIYSPLINKEDNFSKLLIVTANEPLHVLTTYSIVKTIENKIVRSKILPSALEKDV